MSKARLVITAPFAEHQSPAEVAARYGVHRAWVYKLKAARARPSTRDGHGLADEWTALDSWRASAGDAMTVARPWARARRARLRSGAGASEVGAALHMSGAIDAVGDGMSSFMPAIGPMLWCMSFHH